MSEKHTPLPWHHHLEDDSLTIHANTPHHYCVANGNECLTTSSCRNPNLIPDCCTMEERRDANVEFIVRACNSHDDLISERDALRAANEGLLKIIGQLVSKIDASKYPLRDDWPELMSEVEDLLARHAEQKEPSPMIDEDEDEDDTPATQQDEPEYERGLDGSVSYR